MKAMEDNNESGVQRGCCGKEDKEVLETRRHSITVSTYEADLHIRFINFLRTSPAYCDGGRSRMIHHYVSRSRYGDNGVVCSRYEKQAGTSGTENFKKK